MEKSFESSSDSDSNSSTSWVFVSHNVAPVENPTNAFHLDCSHEPIQELTEQDFVSAGSDIESDTDGVSVISESDATNEEYENITCETTSDLQDDEKVTSNIDNNCETISSDMFIPKTLITASKKFFRNSNIVGVGVVLTAVFLGSYTLIVKRITIKDTGDLQSKNFLVYGDIDEDTHTNFIYKNNPNLEGELEEIVDIAVACTYKDQEKNVVQSKKMKKCIKTQYKTKMALKSLIRQSDKFKLENDQPMTNDIIHNNKLHQNTKIDKNKHNKKRFNQKDIGNHKTNNLNECKTKSEKKKHYSSGDVHIKHKKSIKPEKIKQHQSDTRRQYDNEKYFNRKNSSQIKFKHYNINSKKTPILPDRKLETHEKSGEWYSNMHKARQQSRKNNYSNDGHLKKRYKDLWYFKWMHGREELRFKKSYRPYSRSLNI